MRLNVSQFSQAVATATGVNVNAIQQFVNNWTAFFTANPSALQGRTVTQASYGAAFGDAVGVALLNPTSAGLQTVVGTDPAFPFSPNTIQGLVANALINIAEGTYKVGVPLNALPQHALLQGEAGGGPGNFNLTSKVDTLNSTFANTVFNAAPEVSKTGDTAQNTLNAGDTLSTTDGKGTLNQSTVVGSFNPVHATNVKITGVETATVTAGVGAAGSGFEGDVTGLKILNNKNSQDGVTVGGPNNGLHTLLTNINISGYAGPTGSLMQAAIFEAAKGDAAATIAIDIKGAVGSTNADAGGANRILISNDTGTGTKANPNLTYGTWSITSANTANLQLEQDFNNTAGSGVGGAKNLVLAGAGDIAVGTDAGTDDAHWQLLETIDLSKSTGRIAITGQTSGSWPSGACVGSQ